MFVCLPVGMWRANRNPNPCNNPDKILHTHLNLFGAGLTPVSSPIWAWGPKTLKAEEQIFEICLQNKRC